MPLFHPYHLKLVGDRVKIPRFPTDESRGYYYGTVIFASGPPGRFRPWGRHPHCRVGRACPLPRPLQRNGRCHQRHARPDLGSPRSLAGDRSKHYLPHSHQTKTTKSTTMPSYKPAPADTTSPSRRPPRSPTMTPRAARTASLSNTQSLIPFTAKSCPLGRNPSLRSCGPHWHPPGYRRGGHRPRPISVQAPRECRPPQRTGPRLQQAGRRPVDQWRRHPPRRAPNLGAGSR